MLPSSAFLVLTGSVALFLLRGESVGPARVWTARLVAVVLGALCLDFLAEHLTGVDFALDQTFFRLVLFGRQGGQVRPSIVTTLGLLLFVLAVLCLSHPRPKVRVAHQWLAIAVMALAMLPALQQPPPTPTSVNPSKADVTLRIGQVSVDVAKNRTIRTIGYKLVH